MHQVVHVHFAVIPGKQSGRKLTTENGFLVQVLGAVSCGMNDIDTNLCFLVFVSESPILVLLSLHTPPRPLPLLVWACHSSLKNRSINALLCTYDNRLWQRTFQRFVRRK